VIHNRGKGWIPSAYRGDAEIQSLLARRNTVDNGNKHAAGLAPRAHPSLPYYNSLSLAFKQPLDDGFADKFPSEVEKQEKWWKKRALELAKAAAAAKAASTCN